MMVGTDVGFKASVAVAIAIICWEIGLYVGAVAWGLATLIYLAIILSDWWYRR